MVDRGLHLTARAIAVPVPVDLDKLDPQLRAYIAEKVKWVGDDRWDARREATLGMVYAANGLWTEARQAFQNTARLKPKEPLARMYIGVATLELGDLPGAQNLFRDVTVRFPEFAPGWFRLGEALLRGGVTAEAEVAFRRLIALAPDEWRGYAGLGDVKLRQGQLTGAVELLAKALHLDSTSKNAHHLLGLAYRGLGRMTDAQRELGLGANAKTYPMPDAWSRTASQHMKLLQDQFRTAEDYAQAGQPLRGVEILEQALAYHPADQAVINNLAVAYLRASQPEKARGLLLKLVQTDTRNLSAYVTLSTCSATLGLTNEALDFAGKAVELSSNTVAPHLATANALLAMGNDPAALDELEQALRLDPKSAHLHNQIGDVLLRNLDRPDAALAHYRQASELDPASFAAYVRLADVYIRLKKINEARQALDTARTLAPNEPVLDALDQRLRKVSGP